MTFKPGWTDLASPPDARNAVVQWTGRELLMWSGDVLSDGEGVPIEGGFAFDPSSGKTREFPAAPISPRLLAANAWTGEELLIWGGWDSKKYRAESLLDDGAAYNPATETWRVLPPAPISARAPFSVWTGEELLVVGTQLGINGPAMDGAAYDPKSDMWRTIKEAPIRLTDASAVWTGKEMILFGAALKSGNRATTNVAVGAVYDPKRDSWRELPASRLSPQASSAAWDGKEMIAWDYRNMSQAFDPQSWRWRDLPRVPLDDAECSPVSVGIPGAVLGNYCGSMVLYSNGKWTLEESPTLGEYRQRLIDKNREYPTGPGLYPAGVAVLVVVGQEERGVWRMASYRAKG